MFSSMEIIFMSDVLNERYIEFVRGVMSQPSKDPDAFVARVNELHAEGVKVETALTAAVGLPGEVGEVCDIIKKVVFQGKAYTPELRAELEKEMGDVFWYVAAACMAFDLDFDSIMRKNIAKLEARYPGGKFSVERSENRSE